MVRRIFVFVLVVVVGAAAFGESSVKVWAEQITLPSYKLEAADPNPMFYKGESYQGAQKRIYPYPLLDGITTTREQGTFTALFLENEYIQLSVLPEIGGRLFSATDKTNGYEFFYRQHVVKPALIGMLGGWISGGVEWCVFHHHRNTTHMPVDYATSDNPDGSKTIWFGETERRHRMRWVIGLTLHPGRSYVEAKVKMFNRTPQPHSILYWANVAVHVNDEYQVIFPPSVQVATYHSKNDFVHWPIGQGRYRGSDYNGVDLSWWKNHPKPVSCFAWDLQEDFMGGYDHRADAGVVHIGNHHIVCGAKLWEWAPGNIWDTQVLTDSDGPYAELMVGAFSDNQPDYSWIKPYEVKTFTQYWYPVREIGGFKRANLDAAVNLELFEGKAKIGFHATRPYERAQAILKAGDKVLLKETIDIAPGKPHVQTVKTPTGTSETDLKAVLTDSNGRTLIEYQPVAQQPVSELPEAVRRPLAPKDIKTIEELYLTGLRIEQIHNPGIDPFDYYEEALRRDSDDSRTNTIVGINYNKQGRYARAEEHLQRAIERISAEYTRPGNTEAYYHLGLALKAQGKFDAAYDAFYRATWDYAFHSAAHYQLATLSCRRGDFATALEQIGNCLSTNARNTKASNVRAAILRRLGRPEQAERPAMKVLAADPLDFLAMNELYLSGSAAGKTNKAASVLRSMTERMRDDVQSYLELATDYIECGLWDEAMDVLQRPLKHKPSSAGNFPMLHYYLGYLYQQTGMNAKAKEHFASAGKVPVDYCFPFRHESMRVLQAAIDANPSDARAHYYIGNLLYDIQPDKAIEHWEKSRSLDGALGIVHRNLGWGNFRHKQDVAQAIRSYERAIACDAGDPRYYLELDDLYERANTTPDKRLQMLEANTGTIMRRKDLLIRRITLLVRTGDYNKAVNLLTSNDFFISEGGGRELGDAYVDAYLLRGLEYAGNGRYQDALADFEAAGRFPENLSQESTRNERRMVHVQYHIARAQAALGKADAARRAYEEAAGRNTSNVSTERYYQILALRELGRKDKAEELTKSLVNAATQRLAEDGKIDFFAKFGEQATRQAQRADAHCVLGFGLLLQGRVDEAKNQFEQALNFNAAHTWASHHLSELNRDGRKSH